MGDLLNILIVDDDDGDRDQVRRALTQSTLKVRCSDAASIHDAVEACERSAFDCAIVDYRLTGEDGLSGLKTLHASFPHMALIMITGQGDELVATAAMKVGALDYLSKNQLGSESILRSVENAVEKAKLLRTIAEQREDLEVFSQVLVHDLKGPINGLLSMASLIDESIQQGVAEGLPPGRLEEISSYCPSLLRSVRRMDRLIDTLYSYTTAQAQVEFRPLAMREVMIDALGNLEQIIQSRGALVTYDELPTISGSPQLVQLMQNLIGNGIKYCDAEVPLVHVSAIRVGPDLWQFKVKDNGIGIPEEHYRQIFEPFQRLHGVGKYEGTGLGLATCKKIVARHGGTLSCVSENGQGTTFCFTLHGSEAEGRVDKPTWDVETLKCSTAFGTIGLG
jgi:signal transduction histidine kinase